MTRAADLPLGPDEGPRAGRLRSIRGHIVQVVPLSRSAVAMALLLLPLPFLTSATYLGSSDLHAATEVVGALIGLVAGLAFLQRYAALDDRAHLFFGLAFFANASADTVHGVVPFLVSRGLLDLPTSPLAELLPATYTLGRMMAAVVLVAAPTLATRRVGSFTISYARRLSLAVIALGVALAAALYLLPLPRLLFPSRVIGRPADLVVAVVFAAAAVRLFRWHQRTADPMTWWVAVAAAAGAVGELWMSLSGELYDIHFDTGHGYKIVGYLLPLVGLTLYQVRLIAERERLARDLRDHAHQLERAVDELARANAVKSEFVSVVSHELRTPLTAILGFVSTMREFWDTTPEEEKQTYVEIVERQGLRLSRLINDLLAMSRLESGAIETVLDEVDLGPLVRRVVRDVTPRIAGVEVAVPDGTRVVADADHVEQILLNYLSNADRYGRAPIRVTTEPAPDGSVTLVVADDGDGVPEAFRAQLFEKFAQADSGPTRRSQGTGLGLAIVRGLAEAQGGEAWYEPGEPRGARFLVRLPGKASS